MLLTAADRNFAYRGQNSARGRIYDLRGWLNLPTCRGFLLARRNFIYVWQTKPEPPPSRVKICLPAADRIYVLPSQAEFCLLHFTCRRQKNGRAARLNLSARSG